MPPQEQSGETSATSAASIPPILLGYGQDRPSSQPVKKIAKPLVKEKPPWWKAPAAVGLACSAGVLVVVQGGINTNLTRGISGGSYPSAAAFVSFSVGSFCTWTLSFILMPRIGNTTIRKCPWYGYVGGLLGPCYVTAACLLVSELGFAVFQLCVIIGTLLASLTLDRIGFLFLKKKYLNPRRVVSIMLLITGAVLTTASLDTKGKPLWKVALMCLASACVGTVFPIQGCCNGVLVKHILSPFRAVGFTFGLAAVVLSVITVVWGLITSVPFELDFALGDFWMFFGGVCGGALITCNAVGIPILGAAAFTTVFLAVQLLTAVTMDTIGAFNFEAQPLGPARIAGVAVAIFGATLYQFNIVVCPGYSAPPAPATPTSKRASQIAVAAHAARSSLKITADDDAVLEHATEEERETHVKRQSVRNGAS